MNRRQSKTPGPLAASDDRSLVEGARQGDVEAFEELLDRHQERVLRVVLSILKEPMDAEEVTQDVFMTVFDKIEAFRGDASFTTWVHRIAVNAALMRRRRDKSDRHVPLDEVLPAFDERGHLLQGISDWSEQTSDPVLQKEALQIIQQAVDGLDEKYRVVFVLRDVEDFSTEETAAILELSVPAVKSRLHRARLFLRRELAEYFERQNPS